MTKTEQKLELFQNYVRAGYSHFVVPTCEPRIRKLICEKLTAFQNSRGEKPYKCKDWDMTIDDDPMSALSLIGNAEPGTVVFLHNFHWFLKEGSRDREIITQNLLNSAGVYRSKEERKIVIILTPFTFDKVLPKELQRDFISFDFPLPDEDEITTILDIAIETASQIPDFKLPTKEEKKEIVNNSLGMTAQAIENAYFLSALSHKKITTEQMNEMRSEHFKGIAGLHVLKEKIKLDDVIGYDKIKQYFKVAIDSPFSLGSLFVGPPGTGKTMIVKALAHESGKLVAILNLTECSGKYVGESEEKVKAVIDVLTVLKNGIVILDELDKTLAGVGSGEGSDVARRSISQLLDFMNSDNRPKGLKFFGTANAIQGLLNTAPEYLRAERWDTAPIYMSLPDWGTRKKMLAHYKIVFQDMWETEMGKKITIKGDLSDEDTKGWTGAECKAVCRIAMNSGGEMTLQNAKEMVRPISLMAKGNIDHLESMKSIFVTADDIESGKLKLKSRGIDY
uniref:Uncharacterized AAA domain-containing protein ycf46 n=2 Tax=viral metagenome TaxID=1070528 RepID=A0A6M3LDL9_9ZZZZ